MKSKPTKKQVYWINVYPEKSLMVYIGKFWKSRAKAKRADAGKGAAGTIKCSFKNGRLLKAREVKG